MSRGNTKRRGFSLVELVIVIVILGVIAAIAIPRISSGSKNAGDAALKADLQSIRNAIDWYYGEHNNTFPGAKGDGTNAADSAEAFTNQLTQYSDINGDCSTTKDADHPFGPYLRGSFPKLPAGSKVGNANVKVFTDGAPLTADTAQDAGWFYNDTTGQLIPNCADTEKGNDGVAYNLY